MDPHGFSSAVDICRHAEGYRVLARGIRCGTCSQVSALPRTWPTRDEVVCGTENLRVRAEEWSSTKIGDIISC